MFLLAVSAALALSPRYDCTGTLDGKSVHYVQQAYSGGVYPQPGTPMFSLVWTIDSVERYAQRRVARGGPEDGAPVGTLTWSWVAGATEVTGGVENTRVDYRAQVILEDETPLYAEGPRSATVEMTCQRWIPQRRP